MDLEERPELKFSYSRDCPVVGLCKCNDEPWGSINGTESLVTSCVTMKFSRKILCQKLVELYVLIMITFNTDLSNLTNLCFVDY
jgi:hypothetical protein